LFFFVHRCPKMNAFATDFVEDPVTKRLSQHAYWTRRELLR